MFSISKWVNVFVLFGSVVCVVVVVVVVVAVVVSTLAVIFLEDNNFVVVVVLLAGDAVALEDVVNPDSGWTKNKHDFDEEQSKNTWAS